MQRENAQAQKRKAESTDASVRDGPLRSSDEAAVMAAERRGWAVQFKLGQPVMGRTLMPGAKGAGLSWTARAGRRESVTSGICERLEVQFLRPTRQPACRSRFQTTFGGCG